MEGTCSCDGTQWFNSLGTSWWKIIPCASVSSYEGSHSEPTRTDIDGSDMTIDTVNDLQNTDSIDEDNESVEMSNNDPMIMSDIPAEQSVESSISKNLELPRRNSYIRLVMSNAYISNEWKHAKTHSKQPKPCSKYNRWLNITDLDKNDDLCVNWDSVDAWEPTTENQLEEVADVLIAEDVEQKREIKIAKEKELCNLRENNVFTVVPYHGQVSVSSRWVLTEKIKNGKRVIKARLVARGFEEDSSKLQIDSPTCAKESLRLLFVMCGSFSWTLHSIDICSAFLQGKELDRELYLRPPSDVCSRNYIWLLKRCIYGLNDAPRSWYDKVKQTLVALGACVCLYDNCLFFWYDQAGLLFGLLVVHVDDFAFGGNDHFHNTVVAGLKEKLKVGSHDTDTFNYLGLEVNQDATGIQVDQNSYIKSIQPIVVARERGNFPDANLTKHELLDLKRLGGQMNWVSTQTRPDASFEVCVICNTGKSPNVKALKDANRALRKLKNCELKLSFPPLGDPKELRVIAYSDATYGSLTGGASQGAFIVFVQGGNGLVAPIVWQSKKLERVTKSPLASEASAAGEAADAGYFVACILSDIIKYRELRTVYCFTDNKSLVETVKSTKMHSNRKLRVDLSRLREMLCKKEITLSWVEGKFQLANCLTKKGASTDLLLETLKYSKITRY